MSDRPASRITSLTPLYDALAMEFARRELTDRLAATVAGWSEC